MSEERKVQLGVTVNATQAKEGFNEVKRDAQEMAQTVAKSGEQAAKSVGSIGNGSEGSAKKIDAATKSMIGSIQRATAALEAGGKASSKYYEALAAQKGVDVNVLRPYLDQLDQVTKKQTAVGVSAAQTAAAMRQVPAQMTDIVTSLQAGQQPLTVLLQQGGQLKDAFGGIGPAAKAMGGYILGLVNPFTVAAAAAVALAVAYHEGEKEFDAYNRALILTGNAAGTTAEKLAGMADRISKSAGITKGAAAEALVEFASTGQIAASQFEKFTATAVKLQQLAGVAVRDTVKQFVELGKDPVAASIKLNETTNFLTKSIYDQIRALSEQGKSAEAAALAQNAYNDAVTQRIPKLVQNLGYVETAWKKIVDVVKGATDAALDFGRKNDPGETINKALEASYARLEKLRKLGAGKDTQIAIAEEEKRARALSKEAEQYAILTRQKEADAAADEKRQKQMAAYHKWQEDQDKYLTRKQQMDKAIERATNEAAAAGVSPEELKTRIEGIKREYSDLSNTTLAALQQQQALQHELLAGSLAHVESQHKQGLLSEEQYILAKRDIQLKELETEKAIAEEQAKVAGGKKDLAEREKYLGQLKILEQRRKNIEQGAKDQIAEVSAATTKALNAQLTAWANATKTEQDLLAEEAALFGKSAEARKIAVEQNKVDAEVRKLIADRQRENKALLPDEVALLLQEAEARKKNIAAIMGERQALAGAEQLHQENKRFAAEAIVDEQTRAATLLEIDADMWRERIRLAGDGTEAQKQLQQEFDEWYANRQMTPVLDRWKNIIGNLDNDFREGFRNMLTNGEGAWKSFSKSLGNTLKTSLADALYQTFIKKYVVQVVTSLAGSISGPAVASALGGGQTQGVGNLLGMASNGYSLMSGAGNASLASTMNWLGYSNGAGAAINPAVHFSDAAYEAGMANASETGIATSSPALGGSIPVIGGALGAYYGAQKYGPVGGFAMGAGSIAAGGAVSGLAAGSGIMAGASAALAAIPVWGWAALAAMAILGSGGGETRFGGGYDVINGKVVLGGGPDGGEIQGDKIRPIIQGTYDGLKQTLKDLGSNASIDRFTAGLESSEKGKGATFAGGIINGQQFGSTYETTAYNQTLTQEQAVTQFSQKLQQSVLLALKQAGDIPESIAKQLRDTNIEQLTAEQTAQFASAIAAEIAQVKSLQEALSGLPFENLKNLSFDAADGLIAASGGLDALKSNLNGYYDNYFTAEEKKQQLTKTLTEQFQTLGFSLPTTREQFRQMVESVKDMGPAGQQTEAGLLKLQGALSELLPPFDDLSASMKDASQSAEAMTRTLADIFKDQLGSLDTAYSGLERSVSAERDRINELYEAQRQAIQDAVEKQRGIAQEQLDAATSSLSAIQSIYNSVSSALSGARAMSREQALRTVDDALQVSAAGGSLKNVSGLDEALRVVTQISEKDYASRQDFIRDQALTANKLEQLKGNAGAQVSVAQVTVDAAKDTIKAIEESSKAQLGQLDQQHNDDLKRLDDILSGSKAQIDALNGIDNSVKSLTDAMKQIADALSVVKSNPVGQATPKIADAYQMALGRTASQGEIQYWQGQVAIGVSASDVIKAIDNSREAQIVDLYRTLLGRDPDAAGLQYQYNSGLSVDQLRENFMTSDEYLKKIRGFASGGDFWGGWRIVGENGPELEATGPSRIFNASQTAEILRGGANAELIEEVRALRAELSEFRKANSAENVAIAQHSSKTAKYLRRVMPDGDAIAIREVTA